MSRSMKKGPFVSERLYKKVQQSSSGGAIKTWSRSCTIVPEFVGRTFEVHNGRTFHKVYVTEEMVGHKLGEFSPTRTFKSHTMVKPTQAPAAGGKA